MLFRSKRHLTYSLKELTDILNYKRNEVINNKVNFWDWTIKVGPNPVMVLLEKDPLIMSIDKLSAYAVPNWKALDCLLLCPLVVNWGRDEEGGDVTTDYLAVVVLCCFNRFKSRFWSARVHFKKSDHGSKTRGSHSSVSVMPRTSTTARNLHWNSVQDCWRVVLNTGVSQDLWRQQQCGKIKEQ